MPLLNRETLQNLFSRGSRPTEQHFADLIEATANKMDDGFSVSPEHGLCLAPLDNHKKLISVFRGTKDREAAFTFSLNPYPHVNGLRVSDQEGASQLFLKQGGNVGIHTLKPTLPLEVSGYVGMQGRVGTYAHGQVPADSYWQPIVSGLDGLQAFEITAAVVKPPKEKDDKTLPENKKRKRSPRSAFMKAIALAAYEGRGSHNKIKAEHSGWLWDRIYLRWVGDVHNYELQIRTLFSYGYLDKEGTKPVMIDFQVTQLWSDELTLDQREA